MKEDIKDIKVLNETYNLLKWFGVLLKEFPRNHRYGLGLKIEDTLYDIFHLLLEARYSKDKLSLLCKANLELEYSRFLIRLANDLHLFTNKQQYAYIMQMDSIGKQIGGWIKSIKSDIDITG